MRTGPYKTCSFAAPRQARRQGILELYKTSRKLRPLPARFTQMRTGMRSVISCTCEMTPILRPCVRKLSKASIATRSVSASKEPKPSSMKRLSTRIRLDEREDRPSASANETRNDSPPERLWTVRTSSHISRSITCKASVSGTRSSR